MARFKRCHACSGWIPSADSKCPHCGVEQSYVASAFAWLRTAKRGAAGAGQTDFVSQNLSSLLLLGMFVMFGLPMLAMGKNADFSIADYLLGRETLPHYLLGALTKGPPLAYQGTAGEVTFVALDTFRDGQLWRMVTAIFLHHGVIHLGFNSMALAQLGPKVQGSYGAGFFMFVFVASGAIGFWVTYVAYADQVLSAGASGSIFGLIGVGIANALRVKDRAELRTYVSWLIGSVLISFFAPINNWAHFGGLATGFAFATMVPEHRVPVYPQLRKIGSVLGLLATVLVFVCLYFAARFARGVLTGTG